MFRSKKRRTSYHLKKQIWKDHQQNWGAYESSCTSLLLQHIDSSFTWKFKADDHTPFKVWSEHNLCVSPVRPLNHLSVAAHLLFDVMWQIQIGPTKSSFQFVKKPFVGPSWCVCVGAERRCFFFSWSNSLFLGNSEMQTIAGSVLFGEYPHVLRKNCVPVGSVPRMPATKYHLAVENKPVWSKLANYPLVN